MLLCTVGLQREYQVECCGCKSEACTLIELGLWSATPIKPTMAFTFSLMEQLEKKFLIGKLSVKQFCASLPDFFPSKSLFIYMCQSIVHNYSFIKLVLMHLTIHIYIYKQVINWSPHQTISVQ